jgi:hypothetical protein
MTGRVYQRLGRWCVLVTAPYLTAPVELICESEEDARAALAELGEVAHG